jgi:hypothetical protein
MKKTLSFLGAAIAVFFTNAIFASDLSLYENPDANSKVVTTLKSGSQLIPIYSPEKGEWVKVANPKDGTVGWVKSDDLKGPVITTKIDDSTMQQTIVTDKDKSPQTYEVIRFSGPTSLNDEEAQKLAKLMEKRQQKMSDSIDKMQESMQKMVKDMMKEINSNQGLFTFPIIQPIIVVPDIEKSEKNAKSEEPATKK